MSKSICGFLSVLVLLAGFHGTATAATQESDLASIAQLIHDFGAGVDRQDGPLLERAFYQEGVVYGFSADGASIITLPAQQFATLHEEKRFGGQQRELLIQGLSVTDGLLASASVNAFNDEVFYNYRITFIKTDGAWKILTATQRSRAN
tara:strand:- start:588 stop:1034 length:447 start_codon:yes stop_codon:yes gene_type:complete